MILAAYKESKSQTKFYHLPTFIEYMFFRRRKKIVYITCSVNLIIPISFFSQEINWSCMNRLYEVDTMIFQIQNFIALEMGYNYHQPTKIPQGSRWTKHFLFIYFFVAQNNNVFLMIVWVVWTRLWGCCLGSHALVLKWWLGLDLPEGFTQLSTRWFTNTAVSMDAACQVGAQLGFELGSLHVVSLQYSG